MQAFLLARPRGAYTVARASRRTGEIVDLELHAKRLVHGLSVLFPIQQMDLSDWEAISSRLGVEPLAGDKVRCCLLYLAGNESSLVWQDFPLADAFPLVAPRVCIDVTSGLGRSNCTAKDSQWISDRQRLELVKKENDCVEVLLTTRVLESDDWVLLEGLTSNLVVLNTAKKHAWTCSPECVLPGITLQACMRVLEREFGFTVTVGSDAVQWARRDDWDCAFICNVNKPGQFIRELVLLLLDQQQQVKRFNDDHDEFYAQFAQSMKQYYA